MTNLYRLKQELQPMVDDGKITVKQYQDKIDEAIEQDNIENQNKPCCQKKIKMCHFVFMGAGIVIGYLIAKRK